MKTLSLILTSLVKPGFVEGIVSTLVYTAIGIIVAVISYFIVDMLIPGKMGKQIAEDKNLPIAVVAAAMILGICMIIAASII